MEFEQDQTNPRVQPNEEELRQAAVAHRTVLAPISNDLPDNESTHPLDSPHAALSAIPNVSTDTEATTPINPAPADPHQTEEAHAMSVDVAKSTAMPLIAAATVLALLAVGALVYLIFFK